MIIFMLIFGVCFYIALSFIYMTAHPSFKTPDLSDPGFLNMLFLPENTVFLILRGLLLITLFYVVADGLFSAARRKARKRKKDEEDAARMSNLTGKMPQSHS